jgi:hypothetical protein
MYRLRVAKRFMSSKCVSEAVKAAGEAFEILRET